MANNKPLIVSDALLMKYLLGEADVAEVQQVEQWLSENPENRTQFDQFRKIWEESEALAAVSHADENAAWQRFIDKAKGSEQVPGVIPFKPVRRWLSAAAVLLVLITGGYFLYHTFNGSGTTYIVWRSFDKVLTDTLPDGSVVTLNKGATLSFPDHFKGNERLVKLQGEAFFEVTKDKNKPFIITANEARVQVFGTEFNVKTSQNKTEVIVESGIVEVAKNDNTVRLTADERATVTKEEENPLKEKNEDRLYQYYRNKEFVLNGTPLWRLADVLGQAYGVNIIIANEDIRNLKLTTVFKDQPLQYILTVVGETLNITIEQKGADIVLR